VVYGRLMLTNDYEGAYPEYVLNDVRIVRASRTPCIICGHPTGDCKDSTSVTPRQIIGDDMFRRPQKSEPEILVLEDLFDTVQITPRTSTKVLVARAGTYISRSKAIEFGLITP
jgi:hypothetical protein